MNREVYRGKACFLLAVAMILACLSTLAARADNQPAEDILTIVDLFQQEGNFEATLTILSEAVAEQPDNPDLLYRLGVLQAKSGLKDQCLETFSRALERAPDHPDALYARKFLHIQSLKDEVMEPAVEIIFEFKDKQLAEVINEMQIWRRKLDFHYDEKTNIVLVSSDRHTVMLRLGEVHAWYDQTYARLPEPPHREDSIVYIPEAVLDFLRND